MWDNLCIIRELVTHKHLNDRGFYILALDQKQLLTLSPER